MRVADDVACRQGKHFTGLEHRLAVCKISGPDLRALGIQHDGGGQPHRIPHTAEQIDGLAMACMVSMRKIHARYIHARLQHGAQGLFFGGRRS